MTAQQTDLCLRIHSLLQRSGPLYLATVANALSEPHDVITGALVDMMSRGAVVCEPIRNGDKLPRYRAVAR